MIYGYIYRITNTINNKVYIGQTKREPKLRFDEYRRGSHNEHLNSSFATYGFDKFKFEVIDTASSPEELNSKEIYYISYYNSTNSSKGYNLSEGGSGPTGVKWSDTSRSYVKEQRLGSKWFHKGDERHLVRPDKLKEFCENHPDFLPGYGEGRTHKSPSEETRLKMSKHSAWRHKSQETIEKQRDSLKSRKFHWYTNGSINLQIPEGEVIPEGFYPGKFLTEEVKKSMGKQNIGKIPWNKGLTKETDSRVAEYAKHGSETKRKNNIK